MAGNENAKGGKAVGMLEEERTVVRSFPGRLKLQSYDSHRKNFTICHENIQKETEEVFFFFHKPRMHALKRKNV